MKRQLSAVPVCHNDKESERRSAGRFMKAHLCRLVNVNNNLLRFAAANEAEGVTRHGVRREEHTVSLWSLGNRVYGHTDWSVGHSRA